MTDQASPANAPVPTGFDDEEVVEFDQGTVSRDPGAPSNAVSDEEDFEFVELPKPCGIRDAYVHECKVLRPKDGDAPVLLLAVQVADLDFPANDSNPALTIRCKPTDVLKMKLLAAALGINVDAFKSSAGRARVVGVHCRAFVSIYKDKAQIPNFLPSYAKRAEQPAFFDHVDALGIDETAYKKFYDDYCGLLRANV